MNDADRRAAVSREAAETTIDVALAIGDDGDAVVDTGVGFFDHMLEAFAKHDLFDLTVQCDGDLHINDHHTIEGVVIILGEALTEALGDERDIVRYADHKVLLDKAVAFVVIDVSGHPFSKFSGDFSQPYVSKFTSHMVEHFTVSLVMDTGLTPHAGVEGDNAHHEAEALFKALARSLDDATRMDPWRSDTPSTKGKL